MAESAGTNQPHTARDDERQNDRLAILGELRGEVMVFQPLAVTEISLKGAQIETAFPLHLDSLHDFRLSLGERSIVVKGRVAHCWISDVNQEVVQYCSGVEFVEPSARVTEVIQGFLHDIKSGRGPAR
jgi:hypothetical protein